MKDASVTWDESTLDRWLTDTDSVIRDTDMSFRLNDPDERASYHCLPKTVVGQMSRRAS